MVLGEKYSVERHSRQNQKRMLSLVIILRRVANNYA